MSLLSLLRVVSLVVSTILPAQEDLQILVAPWSEPERQVELRWYWIRHGCRSDSWRGKIRLQSKITISESADRQCQWERISIRDRVFRDWFRPPRSFRGIYSLRQ
ncbi:hypothetical protein EDB85DRAFT_736017 [Lactarius pseudohatsudake]|nr:hypothetical protein EDB85DRAFT_736017 [Lactarius pseudohatsudake]